MEFKLNEDQQLMKDMFVEFTEQFVKPIAAELDEQERFPEELIPQLGETGLLGIPVAEEYGGAGADNMSYVLAVEEKNRNRNTFQILHLVKNLVLSVLLSRALDLTLLDREQLQKTKAITTY